MLCLLFRIPLAICVFSDQRDSAYLYFTLYPYARVMTLAEKSRINMTLQ